METCHLTTASLGLGPRCWWVRGGPPSPAGRRINRYAIEYSVTETSWMTLIGCSSWIMEATTNVVCYIHSPHLLVRVTGEGFQPAWGTFRASLASESHWLQLVVLVLSVHWWPTPIIMGGLLVSHVIVVTSLLTLLVNKFTSIDMQPHYSCIHMPIILR